MSVQTRRSRVKTPAISDHENINDFDIIKYQNLLISQIYIYRCR